MKHIFKMLITLCIVAILVLQVLTLLKLYKNEDYSDNSNIHFRKNTESYDMFVYAGTQEELCEYTVTAGDTLNVTIDSSPLVLVLPYELSYDYHWQPEPNDSIMVLSSRVFEGFEMPKGVYGGSTYMQEMTIQTPIDNTSITLYVNDTWGQRTELRINLMNESGVVA